MSRTTVVYRVQRRYGFFNFLFDLIMTGVTGGLWLVWVVIRSLRN